MLEIWYNMVEEGDWEVSEEGVMSGMENWREADTEGEWWKFQVPADRW